MRVEDGYDVPEHLSELMDTIYMNEIEINCLMKVLSDYAEQGRNKELQYIDRTTVK
jgi:hypothetical protein